MHDAVMRPPEAPFREDGIRIGDEITIGEEQKFDQADDVLVTFIAVRNYVSHIDIFSKVCYKTSQSPETLLRHCGQIFGQT